MRDAVSLAGIALCALTAVLTVRETRREFVPYLLLGTSALRRAGSREQLAADGASELHFEVRDELLDMRIDFGRLRGALG